LQRWRAFARFILPRQIHKQHVEREDWLTPPGLDGQVHFQQSLVDCFKLRQREIQRLRPSFLGDKRAKKGDTYRIPENSEHVPS